MKNYILIFSAVLFTGCNQKNNRGSESNLEAVTVANREDPVCHMKVSEALSDTLSYKGALYGFCSGECKAAFKKQPAMYSVK